MQKILRRAFGFDIEVIPITMCGGLMFFYNDPELLYAVKEQWVVRINKETGQVSTAYPYTDKWRDVKTGKVVESQCLSQIDQAKEIIRLLDKGYVEPGKIYQFTQDICTGKIAKNVFKIGEVIPPNDGYKLIYITAKDEGTYLTVNMVAKALQNKSNIKV